MAAERIVLEPGKRSWYPNRPCFVRDVRVINAERAAIRFVLIGVEIVPAFAPPREVKPGQYVSVELSPEEHGARVELEVEFR